MLVGLVALVVGASSAFAQSGVVDDERTPPDGVPDKIEELKVVGKQQEALEEDLGKAVGELSGDELRLKLSSTLGETIASEPGVHNASFGPGVGLPVLRGLSGIRVRASEGGIGAWDASAISPDHASTVEAVLADRIEIVRGPSTLRNGSGAIGGVVNVETNRIHEQNLDEALTTSFETRYEMVNHHQRTAAGKLDLRMDRFIFHVDGFARDHDDVDIPGHAIDENAVAEQFFFDASLDNTDGFIANTDAAASGGAVGLSFVTDRGYVGVAASRVDNDYGIPPGAHTEPGDAHGHPGHSHSAGGIAAAPDIRIDLAQTRYDLKAGWRFTGGGLKDVELIVGEVDYEHMESEADAPGTLFESDVTEARLSVGHDPILGLSGEFGVHYVDRYFAATGRESFVPPSDTDMTGVFLIERLDRDRWSLEAGMRAERVRLEQLEPTAPLRPTLTQFTHEPIEYDLYSYSAAVDFSVTRSHGISLLLGRSARAPDVQELIALGPHLATRSYAIGALIRGEEILEPETFNSVDLGWRYNGWAGDITVEAFYTEADDFVYQANTGVFYDLAEEFFRFNCARIEECLPVYEYTQQDATLKGFEWQWQLPALNLRNGELGFEIFGDYVRGRLETDEDLPRMPPRRLGIGAGWVGSAWTSDLRVTYVSAQNRPGVNESSTGSYTDVSGSVSYLFAGSGPGSFLVFLRGKNLLDEEIRNASSFLRSFAPEPGRSVEVGVRFDY